MFNTAIYPEQMNKSKHTYVNIYLTENNTNQATDI